MKTIKRLARQGLMLPGLKRWLPLSLYVRLYPTNAADLVQRSMMRSRRPFRFVQVGSNDGKTGDPLYEAVTNGDVRGMLIEPVPALFAKLQDNYSGYAGLTFVNAAITAEEGTADLHWLPAREGDPMWAGLLGSFSRDIILSHADDIPDIADRMQTIPVSCRRLPSVLAEHGFRRVDLLHIDAEGADFAILSTIDFYAAWTPRHILYEQKHLGPDGVRALDLLRGSGYRTLDLGMDVFAERRLTHQLRARLSRRTRDTTGAPSASDR